MASVFAPSRSKALRQAISASHTTSTSLPSFLLPAFQTRAFSATSPCASKLGRTPLAIPPGVEITLGNVQAVKGSRDWKPHAFRTITVKGPLGELSYDAPAYVRLEQDLEEKRVLLSVENSDDKAQAAMWGTSWSYLNNHITGVSEGHSAILRLVGVGYRATVERRNGKAQFPGQQFLCLKLGFTHPVEEPIPRGLKVTTPQPTRILIEGNEKETIMSFAGRVKQWRKPEPYKGKGVFINDETIKLKSKKIS